MLHPKQNRIDYGNQLIPPEGYVLQQAIGTTYSLDLEALMILPVALFYSQPLDGDPEALRFDMLDAITKAAEKITVYCQKAQIKVPNKFHHLIAYWEKGIREIQMADYNQSFHPKIWVVQYVHPSRSPVYRVLITSRNLTFARDWDIAFSSEGEQGEEIIKQNAPLVAFLKALEKQSGKLIPPAFYEGLQRVKFENDLGKFDKLYFHPIGVSDDSEKLYINPITKSKWWDEILIISPFVDNATLKKITAITGKKRFLLSRKDELDSINLEVLNDYKCFQFSSLIEQAELNEELNETELDPVIQNLHAKLFITQNENKIHWFLGSANCTDPAQGRNIEFMVELKGEVAPGIRPRDIFNQLTNPDKLEGIVLFEEYDPLNRVDVTGQKEIELQVRKIKYILSLLTLNGEAIPVEGGTAFDLVIKVDAAGIQIPKGFRIKVKPISEEQKKSVDLKEGQLNIIDHFTGYPETRLSPFVEFEIWHNESKYTSFLLKMEIELPLTRLNKIFLSIIDSRDKFMKYLSFLLTGEETSFINDINKINGKATPEFSHAYLDQLPIYEKLLIAASRFPAKLEGVDKLIQKLKDESEGESNNIITPEFEEFWTVFSNYHKSLENAR